MAAYNKFNTFPLDLGNKVHNLSSDQLVVALTASANAPVATNAILADLTQISYTNLSSRNVTTTSWTQSSGTAKLVCADLVLTASGTVAAFRYVVLYNSAPANGPLIAWWDFGSDLTLQSGETFTVDFSQTNGVFTIA